MPSKRNLAKHTQYLTAYALLSHSIAYLAWTQGVEGIGILDEGVKTSATAVLALLKAIATSPTLGVLSHEPGPLNHLGFGLDVWKVVSAIIVADATLEDSEWDMVDR